MLTFNNDVMPEIMISWRQKIEVKLFIDWVLDQHPIDYFSESLYYLTDSVSYGETVGFCHRSDDWIYYTDETQLFPVDQLYRATVFPFFAFDFVFLMNFSFPV